MKEFKCSKCGNTKIIQVTVNVTAEFTCDLMPDFGMDCHSPICSDGDVQSYKCGNGHYILLNGEPVDGEEGLRELLEG